MLPSNTSLPPDTGLPPEVWTLVRQSLPQKHALNSLCTLFFRHWTWHHLTPKEKDHAVRRMIAHDDRAALSYAFDRWGYQLPNQGKEWFSRKKWYRRVQILVLTGKLDTLKYLVSKNLDPGDFRHFYSTLNQAVRLDQKPTVLWLFRQMVAAEVPAGRISDKIEHMEHMVQPDYAFVQLLRQVVQPPK